MDDESAPIEPQTPTPTMQYEETPIITPVSEPIMEQSSEEPLATNQEPVQQEAQPTMAAAPKKRSPKSFVKGFFIFVLLFIVGYALSGVIRNIITSTSTAKIVTTPPTPTPVPVETLPEATNSSLSMLTIPAAISTPMTQASPSAWKQYNPVHGTTRTPITSIQFSLPGSILSPICDGSSCGSQGTYLPGGTRLTIAPRGVGEVLADFRGKVISDASGKTLTTKDTTIAGKKATEYSTENVGSTAGGYAFSAMHGYMIEVTDTLSFEINHFSPSGIKTDFSADDTVFKSIVATITFTNDGTTKGSVIPTTTIAPIR